MEPLTIVKKHHHGRYQSPNIPNDLSGDEYVMVERRDQRITGPYLAGAIEWHHQGTPSDPIAYWVVIRPQTIQEIRVLLGYWVATSFLAVTKSNEATNPHGHYIEDKQGNRKHVEAVKFSVPGAVMRATGCKATILNPEASAIMNLLRRAVDYPYFQHWEDEKGRKAEHIEALFDRVFGKPSGVV